MQQNIIILEYEDLEMSMPIIVIVESFGMVVLLDKLYTKYQNTSTLFHVV